jgi:hypothetical protein
MKAARKLLQVDKPGRKRLLTKRGAKLLSQARQNHLLVTAHFFFCQSSIRSAVPDRICQALLARCNLLATLKIKQLQFFNAALSCLPHGGLNVASAHRIVNDDCQIADDVGEFGYFLKLL